MSKSNHDWASFWDLASPEEAAGALREIYGVACVQAAARCAHAAQTDGSEEDYRFWMTAISLLDPRADGHDLVQRADDNEHTIASAEPPDR